MKIGNEPSFVDGVPVSDQLVKMVKELPLVVATMSIDGKVLS